MAGQILASHAIFTFLLKVGILVYFHTPNKDIPKTGQFTKERGLTDLQFHIARETSQSWQKARISKSHLTWMAAGKERACAGKLLLTKPSDLARLIHCYQNSMGETSLMIQISLTRLLPQHVDITGATIQNETWVGTQPNHIK